MPHMAQLADFMRYQVHAAIPAITPKHAAGVRKSAIEHPHDVRSVRGQPQMVESWQRR